MLPGPFWSLVPLRFFSCPDSCLSFDLTTTALKKREPIESFRHYESSCRTIIPTRSPLPDVTNNSRHTSVQNNSTFAKKRRHINSPQVAAPAPPPLVFRTPFLVIPPVCGTGQVGGSDGRPLITPLASTASHCFYRTPCRHHYSSSAILGSSARASSLHKPLATVHPFFCSVSSHGARC